MSVMVEFDKPRELKFDLRALRDLENALGGRPLAQIINDIANLGINAMVAALWAGMKHEDRALTQSLTEKLFTQYIKDKKSLRALARAINDSLDETGLFRDESAEGNEVAAQTKP